MQVLCFFSAILLIMGTAHAMVTLSPTDLVASELMKAANLTSRITGHGNYHPKRQSYTQRRFTVDEFNQCEAVGQRVECESGLQQELHTLALQCQQQVAADIAEFSCGVNSNGVYCAQGPIISREFETGTMNCTISSCSLSCRSAISDLNEELGCCSGYWTQARLGTKTNLDGNIWSACSIVPGDLCPIPTFDSTVPTSRSCTIDDTNRILLSHRCLQENNQPVVQAVANAFGCSPVAEFLDEVCDRNPNGKFCTFQIAGQATLIQFIRDCVRSALLIDSFCSPACRNSMIAFRDDVGCCMNSVYNGTLARILPGNTARFEQVLAFFANSLWARCNVATPGFCDESNGSTKTGGVLSIIALLVMGTVLL